MALKIVSNQFSNNIFQINVHGRPIKIERKNIIDSLMRHFAEQTKWLPIEKIEEK